jgi:hypothetical protein
MYNKVKKVFIVPSIYTSQKGPAAKIFVAHRGASEAPVTAMMNVRIL